MKDSLTKKKFGQVSAAHGIIIILTLFIPFFRGCWVKKPDVVTFIDLSGAPAPAQASVPEPEPEDTPEMAVESKPEPKPEPKPKPKPEKKTTPEPAKTNLPPKKAVTNAPPKKTETKKPATTNAAPRPKTLAERLAAVRKGGKPVTTKPAVKSGSPLDVSGLQAALKQVATGSGSSSGSASGNGAGSGGGAYSPFAWYYDQVEQQMLSPGVWQQPAGLPIGTTATATIRVERDGTVSLKSITSRSGNVQFDQSVQNALNVTVRLPPPPTDPEFDRNILVYFVLR